MDREVEPMLGTEERAAPPRMSGRVGSLGTVASRLGTRSVVLVGLMGAGKTTVGRRLATRLDLPFRDADAEIETAAGMTVPEIFTIYGEAAFRDVERRVIARLLNGGPLVIATGGGAYVDPATRERIAAAGVSIWLKADHATLMRRVRRRTNRPLLQTDDPDETMRRLMAARHPLYEMAALSVESREGSHDRVVDEIMVKLETWLAAHGPAT